MAKVRLYSSDRYSFSVNVIDGKLLFSARCLINTQTFPRYEFQNFGLFLPDYNYEIARFMKAVSKYLSGSCTCDNVEEIIFKDDNLFSH